MWAFILEMLFCEYFYSLWWADSLYLLHGLLWKVPAALLNMIRYYFLMQVHIQFLFVYPGEEYDLKSR